MQDEDFEEIQCGFVPKETNADMKKCVKLFRDWASARNGHSSSIVDRVSEDILLTDDHGLLAQWLGKFCTEAQKQDGCRYPQHYLMGLQRYIRAQMKNAVNFMEDVEFLPLQNLLDTLYCKLCVDGAGCSVEKTDFSDVNFDDLLHF